MFEIAEDGADGVNDDELDGEGFDWFEVDCAAGLERGDGGVGHVAENLRAEQTEEAGNNRENERKNNSEAEALERSSESGEGFFSVLGLFGSHFRHEQAPV